MAIHSFWVVGSGTCYGKCKGHHYHITWRGCCHRAWSKTRTVRLLSMLSVVLLTGTAVALVGKIAFVGLIIPHIVRFLVGEDYRLIIPCSLVMGAFFLSLCDLVSRYVNFPFETPIGVITAIIGVPFFYI